MQTPNFQVEWARDKWSDGDLKPTERTVFFGGIHPAVQKRHLRSFCTKEFGPVEAVQIMWDYDTGHSKGYGFVHFVDLETANRVKNLGTVRLFSRQMDVRDVTASEKRNKLCRFFADGGRCLRSDCPFAHDPTRVLPPGEASRMARSRPPTNLLLNESSQFPFQPNQFAVPNEGAFPPRDQLLDDFQTVLQSQHNRNLSNPRMTQTGQMGGRVGGVSGLDGGSGSDALEAALLQGLLEKLALGQLTAPELALLNEAYLAGIANSDVGPAPINRPAQSRATQQQMGAPQQRGGYVSAQKPMMASNPNLPATPSNQFTNGRSLGTPNANPPMEQSDEELVTAYVPVQTAEGQSSFLPVTLPAAALRGTLAQVQQQTAPPNFEPQTREQSLRKPNLRPQTQQPVPSSLPTQLCRNQLGGQMGALAYASPPPPPLQAVRPIPPAASGSTHSTPFTQGPPDSPLVNDPPTTIYTRIRQSLSDDSTLHNSFNDVPGLSNSGSLLDAEWSTVGDRVASDLQQASGSSVFAAGRLFSAAVVQSGNKANETQTAQWPQPIAKPAAAILGFEDSGIPQDLSLDRLLRRSMDFSNAKIGLNTANTSNTATSSSNAPSRIVDPSLSIFGGGDNNVNTIACSSSITSTSSATAPFGSMLSMSASSQPLHDQDGPLGA